MSHKGGSECHADQACGVYCHYNYLALFGTGVFSGATFFYRDHANSIK